VRCEATREQLPEHLLGSLGPEEDAAVRRHLRGCGACRQELAGLGEGLSTFARAAHQADPPADLRDRVLDALAEDRADPEVAAERPRRLAVRPVLLRAAAVVALAGSLAWGALATVHANDLSGAAGRYHAFLHALGGRDVRVAVLHPTGSREVGGDAILYDSDVGQSWALVLVRAPGTAGRARVVLTSPAGRIALRPIQFSSDGDGSTWLVTSADISRFDRCIVLSMSGHMLATGRVRSG